MTESNSRWLFFGPLGFAVLICLIYAARNWSFWLDENFIYQNLVECSPRQILFGGVLSVNQLFPRTYLFLIDFFRILAPQSTLLLLTPLVNR